VRHYYNILLTDRINGRAYVTVFRPSLCTECIVAKRCVLRAIKRYYWQPIGSPRPIWEIDWYQNGTLIFFRGRIKVMSTTALHSMLNISETVRDRRLVPKDHQ